MPESSRRRSVVGGVGVVGVCGGVGGARRILVVLTALFLGGVVGIPQALAQQKSPDQLSDAQLLDDFVHYIFTSNTTMAQATAQALLDRGLSASGFVGVIEDSPNRLERFEQAYLRALQSAALEDLAARLYDLYEMGRRERARDPNEIARNIELLKGSPRGRILARQRLSAAGEYAAPQLLEVIALRTNAAIEAEASELLVSMGRQAVGPLSVALVGVDGPTQERVGNILGRIGYRSALPYLVEANKAVTNPSVKAATKRAIEALGGGAAEQTSLAGLYRSLGEQYYSQPRSLTSFPGEAYQLAWSYDPSLGLTATAILTEVYHEAMAMALAEKALKFDPSDQLAVSLWIAANFSREMDQPADYENPAYPGSERRAAMYYAVAAGPAATQRVLGRALSSRDTRLARKAIEALSRSAGASGLVGDQRALVDALAYPERRVRYEAAIALGRAQPRESFDGAELVTPILASVIRDASSRFAVILGSDIERQQKLRGVVEEMGYTALAPGMTLGDVAGPIAESPAVDLVVTDLTAEATLSMLSQARGTARLRATPILCVLPAAAITQHGGRFESDELSAVVREGLNNEQLRASIEHLVATASGEPISVDEAEQYALRALDTLRELAIGTGAGGSVGGSVGGSGVVFDVADAASPLIAAISDSAGEVRLRVADVLSYIGQQRAQVALMDAVMESAGQERLALMARVIGSAKRFGNLLQERHLQWLSEAAGSPEEEDAVTAASLMGALNLPNDQIVPLILGRSR